jgi:hypothetical protein
VRARRTIAAAGFALAAIFLGAAGPYTDRLAPDQLRHIKTVAVISSLGNSFQFERVPDAPFAWLAPPDSRFLETSDWKIDPLVTHTVTAGLARRFKVETIAYKPADFSTWSAMLLTRATLDLNGDPGIDAYVLVLRDWRRDAIGGSVHQLGGLGLYRKDGARPKYGVFACYRVVVVDALTGAMLASRAARFPNGALPWVQANADLWPKTPNNLSDAQRTTLAADEKALIDATLLPTLIQMNLTR